MDYQHVDRFLIYKAVNENPLRLATSVNGDQLYYADNRIEVGNTYRYAIKAMYKNGAESPLSDPVKVSY